MENTLSWISVVLGVAGVSYGIYQNKQKIYIERLATLQAWEVYQSAQQASGWLNDFLKEKADSPRKETLLAEVHARIDSHFSKTIHNLYTHHAKVTPELIERWVTEGRINEHSRGAFLKHLGEKYDA